MKGFKSQIEKNTLENKDFRRVLYTSKHMQLVLMCLKPGTEIGEEIHESNDQFFRFESGHGKCILDEQEYVVTDGDALVIPAGAKHNIINTSKDNDLLMYTIYAPPHHQNGIVRKTREEAETQDAPFDGRTSE